MRKLKDRAVKWLAQSHITKKWRSSDLVSLASESRLLPTKFTVVLLQKYFLVESDMAKNKVYLIFFYGHKKKLLIEAGMWSWELHLSYH